MSYHDRFDDNEASPKGESPAMQQSRSHNEFQLLISKSLDGELAQADAERLAAHLACCDSCQQEQRQQRLLQRVLRRDTVQAPVGLAQRIVAHVERQAEAEPVVVSPVIWLRRSAVAAAVLIMALASLQLASLPDEAVADTKQEINEGPTAVRPDYVRVLKRRPDSEHRPLEFLDLFVPQRAEGSSRE